MKLLRVTLRAPGGRVVRFYYPPEGATAAAVRRTVRGVNRALRWTLDADAAAAEIVNVPPHEGAQLLRYGWAAAWPP